MTHFDGFHQDECGWCVLYFTVDSAADEYHLYNEFPHSELVITYRDPTHADEHRNAPPAKQRLDRR